MAKSRARVNKPVCHCGSEVEYLRCCGRYLEGEEIPLTAEQLMRSRYCGFVLCDEPYLLATWHPETRPGRVRLDGKVRWLGLNIRDTEAGELDDRAGSVEFVARFKADGKGHRLHEISRFEKIEGRWYYLDGQHL
jgi:SEC-C motif-containing protein